MSDSVGDAEDKGEHGAAARALDETLAEFRGECARTRAPKKPRINCTVHDPYARICLWDRYWMDRALAAERSLVAAASLARELWDRADDWHGERASSHARFRMAEKLGVACGGGGEPFRTGEVVCGGCGNTVQVQR